jgi:hypothetical protein
MKAGEEGVILKVIITIMADTLAEGTRVGTAEGEEILVEEGEETRAEAVGEGEEIDELVRRIKILETSRSARIWFSPPYQSAHSHLSFQLSTTRS